MSLAEIEAELLNLSPDELRQLALKSWTAFVAREASADCSNDCREEDSKLLAALDEAIAEADSRPGDGHSAAQIHARLGEWISK